MRVWIGLLYRFYIHYIGLGILRTTGTLILSLIYIYHKFINVIYLQWHTLIQSVFIWRDSEERWI